MHFQSSKHHVHPKRSPPDHNMGASDPMHRWRIGQYVGEDVTVTTADRRGGNEESSQPPRIQHVQCKRTLTFKYSVSECHLFRSADF